MMGDEKTDYKSWILYNKLWRLRNIRMGSMRDPGPTGAHGEFSQVGSFIKAKFYELKEKLLVKESKTEMTNSHRWRWRTTKVVVKVVNCTRTRLLISLLCIIVPSAT